jgi:prepilin-type N-terminal cleavage/methylation domain-containing protein
MNKNKKNLGFTLIELLMVIAIIGILAGILIPTVGAVRKQANIAASKAQLANYVTAITMFKGEYGYYPFSNAQTNNGANINSLSDDFIETLSGRNSSGDTVNTGGNRRRIAFHSFSESEFFYNDDDTVDYTKLADRFNNTQIFIAIDGDGDGEVSVPGNNKLKSPVTAYVVTETTTGTPAYSLYD